MIASSLLGPSCLRHSCGKTTEKPALNSGLTPSAGMQSIAAARMEDSAASPYNTAAPAAWLGRRGKERAGPLRRSRAHRANATRIDAGHWPFWLRCPVCVSASAPNGPHRPARVQASAVFHCLALRLAQHGYRIIMSKSEPIYETLRSLLWYSGLKK